MSGDAARRAADAALAAAREDLARAERRRDAGIATDADVLALVVHVADLQQRAIQAEGDAAYGSRGTQQADGQPRRCVSSMSSNRRARRSTMSLTRPNVAALLAEADARAPGAQTRGRCRARSPRPHSGKRVRR